MHRVTANAVADRPAETSAGAYSCLHARRCYATLRWASVLSSEHALSSAGRVVASAEAARRLCRILSHRWDSVVGSKTPKQRARLFAVLAFYRERRKLANAGVIVLDEPFYCGIGKRNWTLGHSGRDSNPHLGAAVRRRLGQCRYCSVVFDPAKREHRPRRHPRFLISNKLPEDGHIGGTKAHINLLRWFNNTQFRPKSVGSHFVPFNMGKSARCPASSDTRPRLGQGVRLSSPCSDSSGDLCCLRALGRARVRPRVL